MATSSASTSVDPRQAAASASTAPIKLSPAVPGAPGPSTPRRQLTTLVSPQISSYFIAGGVAGAVSRTVVSPLERLKIIQQVQTSSTDKQYRGVWRSLVRIWQEEGFPGFMRGNGINCLRIVPYSAVQFTTYEQLKKWFTNYGQKPLDTPTRLLSGALAGITSVCSTYPLDLVRSRLSIATATITLPVNPSSAAAPATSTGTPALASGYHTASAAIPPSSTSTARPTLAQVEVSARTHLTMLGMARKVMREEGGVRALYRGLPATAFGVAPYVGINFASYEALRGMMTPVGGPASIPRKLACGALAGCVSQTLTYPMDVLRRKMQVASMPSLGVRHRSAFDAMRYILRTEGVRGMYKGLWPNLLKVAPSIATSFFTYELVKESLLPPQ